MDPNPKSGGWMWLNRNPGFNLTSSLKKETKIYTLYICYKWKFYYHQKYALIKYSESRKKDEKWTQLKGKKVC